MQISSINIPIGAGQDIKQLNLTKNNFDIMYNQLIGENTPTTHTQELIDNYKADLLAKVEESSNSSISSSDILNLMLSIK